MAARICRLALAGVIALCTVPAFAQAKPGCGGTTTTPGTSEIDQYTETVPGTCGDQPNGGGGDPPSGGGESGGRESGATDSTAGGLIAPSTVNELESLGADGAAAAALADANAPQNAGSGRVPGEDAGNGQPAESGQGGSTVTPIIEALTGSDGDGMGAVLPVVLLAVAAAGIAFVIARGRAGKAT